MVGQNESLLWVLYGLNWASRVRGVCPPAEAAASARRGMVFRCGG